MQNRVQPRDARPRGTDPHDRFSAAGDHSVERREIQPQDVPLTYATRMVRAGFDVRTVQHWMGHKSLETTMRYLAPAVDVHQRLDQVQIAGVLGM